MTLDDAEAETLTRIDNRAIYNANWESWLDMKRLGPAGRWLRFLIRHQVAAMKACGNVSSILDVGCGEGTITWELAKHFPTAETIGVDFSITGIQCAQASYELPNLQFAHDTTSKALNDHYDLVTAFEVLEHVEDWQDVLGRMANASQQFILISFPLGRSTCMTSFVRYQSR